MFTIKVGSKTFNITKTSAKSIEGSVLCKVASHEITKTEFDRDPLMFRFILNAHRTGNLHIPRDVCPYAFKEEMVFWEIPLYTVAPCCWKTLYEIDAEIDTLKLLIDEEFNHRRNAKKGNRVHASLDNKFHGVNSTKTKDKKDSSNRGMGTCKNRLWLFLEEPESSKAAKIWSILYIVMVLFSVVLFVTWSESFASIDFTSEDKALKNVSNAQPENVPPHNAQSNGVTSQNDTSDDVTPQNVHRGGKGPKESNSKGKTTEQQAMLSIDILCMLFFAFEALLHFCSCPHKKRYFFDVYNSTKVILCIPMMMTIGFEMAFVFSIEKGKPNDMTLERIYFACRSLNVLRLILLFKLRKVYNGLHIMLLSIERSLKELLLLVFSFGLAVVMYGCLIFTAEIESDTFPSTQMSMWWALITMTTVGYGDFYPTTTYGYFIGSLCAVNGVIVIALPVAAIAGKFNELYARNGDLQKHKKQIQEEALKHQDKLEDIR